MINLASTDKLQLITSGTANIDVLVSWVDLTTATGAVAPDSTPSTISSATTTDILAAPSSGIVRNAKTLNLRNRHASASNTLTVQWNRSATVYELIKVTLLAGQQLTYVEGAGWSVIDANGLVKNSAVVDPFTNGFRLTGVTGTPVMTADSTSLSTVYCTPFCGNQIALYDGTYWQLVRSAEFSLGVTGRTTDLPFDIFCYNNAGVATLEFLDWSSATARATGLTRVDGVWTKTGDPTRRYMGSCRARSATTYHWVLTGTDLPVKMDLFNNDNRVEVRFQLKAASPTTWNYTLTTIRQAQASANYQVDVMVGVQEEYFEGLLQVNSTNSTISIGRSVGIGYDVTNAFTSGQNTSAINTVASIMSMQEARLSHQPAVGRHFYAWNESSVATGTATWTGTSATSGFALQSGMTGAWRC